MDTSLWATREASQPYGTYAPLASSELTTVYSRATFTDEASSTSGGLPHEDVTKLEAQMDRMARRVKRMEDAREGLLCGLLGDDADQADVDETMEEMRQLIANSRASNTSRDEEGDAEEEKRLAKKKADKEEEEAAMDAAILALKYAKDGIQFKKVLSESIKQDWLDYDSIHGNIYRVWAFGCLAWPDSPGQLQARWWQKKLKRARNQELAQVVQDHIDAQQNCCFCWAKDYGQASELLNGIEMDDPEMEIWDIVKRGNIKFQAEWCFRANFCPYINTIFKLLGCWSVLLIQTVGPFATVLSCIFCWGIEHEDRYDWRKLRGAVGLSHWHSFSDSQKATKIIAALFIFAFNLNGWFVVVAEGGTWAKVHRVFKFLNCDSKTNLREWWLIAGAWINCFAVLGCCLCVPVYVGDSDTVLDVFMDALALLFLFNLDDVGGDLGFVREEDWPGWELSWVYETKLKKRREPERAVFLGAWPFVSLEATTLLMYKVVGFMCMVLSFIGPFCAAFVNWDELKYGTDAEYMKAFNMVGSVYR